MIKLTPVESSMIEAIGHNQETKILRVLFKNGVMYDYAGVSEEKYNEFKNSKSIGKEFHSNIKKKYEAKKIEEE